MAPVRLAFALSLVLVGACYPPPVSPNTIPPPEPSWAAGPPGGPIDPTGQYSNDPGDPGAGAYFASAEPSADPNAPGYAIGPTNDTEIDTTLDGYGEWVWEDDYGWVWRPYATVVGVDFTPYESCGSWVWTDDWGWTFACEWDWGWLPFHYGRWGWFDDSWAWVPDYEWSPGWVEWRSGGGYVGWRPLEPLVRDHRHHDGPTVRDHRHAQSGPIVRDHRRHSSRDSQWRFMATADFGKRIRPNLFKEPAEGLRLTAVVPRPPVRAAVQPVRAASIMRGRLQQAAAIAANNGVRPGRPNMGPRAVPPVYTPSVSGGSASTGSVGSVSTSPINDDNTGGTVWAPGRLPSGASSTTPVGTNDGGTTWSPSPSVDSRPTTAVQPPTAPTEPTTPTGPSRSPSGQWNQPASISPPSDSRWNGSGDIFGNDSSWGGNSSGSPNTWGGSKSTGSSSGSWGGSRSGSSDSSGSWGGSSSDSWGGSRSGSSGSWGGSKSSGSSSSSGSSWGGSRSSGSSSGANWSPPSRSSGSSGSSSSGSSWGGSRSSGSSSSGSSWGGSRSSGSSSSGGSFGGSRSSGGGGFGGGGGGRRR